MSGLEKQALYPVTAGSRHGPLRAFLGWWSQELAAVFGRRNQAVRWDTGSQSLESAKRGSVDLIWPRSATLVRSIQLPFAAEGDLDGAVRFELGRHLPFPVDEAVIGTTVSARDSAREMIDLDVCAVRQSDVLKAVEASRKARQNVRRVCVEGDHGPAQTILRGKIGPGGGLILLGALAILSLAAGVAVPLATYGQQKAGLEDRMVAAQSKLTALRATIAPQLSVQIGLAGIAATKRNAPSMALIVEDLSRQLPDTAWIRFLRFDGQTLALDGTAIQAAEVAEALEASAYLSNVSFQAPTVTDPATGRERFRIVAQTAGRE